jgi:hypothetical protein
VKFRGGSAGISAGGLRDLAITPAPNTSNGKALVFSGVTTVRVRDVAIGPSSGGTFAEGVRFWNEEGSDFTEFCTFEGGSISACNQPIKYAATNGVESFHGSGVRGNALINMIDGSTTPIITIDDGVAMPYNAPMEFTAFPQPNNWIIYNGSTANARPCSFYGAIHLEGVGGTPNFVMGTGTNQVLFQGPISFFNTSTASLGNIQLVEKIIYTPSGVRAQYKPRQINASLTSSSTSFSTFLGSSESALIDVSIVATNYHHSYTLMAWQSPYDPGGNITQLSHPYAVDSRSWGAPTFSYSNYSLTVTNSNYNAPAVPVTIHIGITPLGGGTVPILPQ